MVQSTLCRGWRKCEKHNMPYPRGSKCPVCEKEIEEEEEILKSIIEMEICIDCRYCAKTPAGGNVVGVVDFEFRLQDSSKGRSLGYYTYCLKKNELVWLGKIYKCWEDRK